MWLGSSVDRALHRFARAWVRIPFKPEFFFRLLFQLLKLIAHCEDQISPMKTRLLESQAEAYEPTNHNASSQPLQLQCSAHDSIDLVLTVDRKRRRHKQHRYSSFDSVASIFARSHRSVLLIVTPTPSLVKPAAFVCSFYLLSFYELIIF